jgi:hypothetical protein
VVNFIYIPSILKYVSYFHTRLGSAAESADFLTSFQRSEQTPRNQIEKISKMQREIRGARNQIEKISKMQREIRGARNQIEKVPKMRRQTRGPRNQIKKTPEIQRGSSIQRCATGLDPGRDRLVSSFRRLSPVKNVFQPTIE